MFGCFPQTPNHEDREMPDLAAFHPQIVHFVIALAFVGVILRIVAFTPWFAFANVAARTLILVSTVAALLAVKSGDQAHGPVERIPGARDMVVEHEEAGEQARTILLAVAALELLAWGLARGRPRLARGVVGASAVAGVVALASVTHAAGHGGELVYQYAGGVGTRSGDPADIERLLVAALYNGALTDRRAGRGEQAARLIDELARRRPDDVSVRLLVADSKIKDRSDARGALAQLDSLQNAAGAQGRLRLQLGHFRADAYLALGQRDSARLALEALRPEFAANARLTARIDSLR
jgi:uncharacterized membrane protein